MRNAHTQGMVTFELFAFIVVAMFFHFKTAILYTEIYYKKYYSTVCSHAQEIMSVWLNTKLYITF